MKTKRQIPFYTLALLFLLSCNQNNDRADAYGNFEVDVTVVSSLMAGQLVVLNIEEGAMYEAGQMVALVDTIDLHLQKPEIEANRKATASQSVSISAQIDVLNNQLANLDREYKRITNLEKAGAATSQQKEELEGQIDVVKSQIESAKSQYTAVSAQLEAIDAKKKQLDEKIKKSQVINPIDGKVLTKLSERYEFTAPGKALYSIANTNYMDLRAYISGSQLADVKLGDTFAVKIDGSDGAMISYPGKVIWMAEEAEFTPKTIQTKEERVNLMYAIKVRVENDGKIKRGMPGELWLNQDF